MRTIAYTYDGLQRLIGAQESPGTAYAYQYDLAGNRTQVAANGAITQQHRYDAAGYPRAGDVQGGTYDAAGNLTGDGTSTNSYDDTRARVPGRLTAGTVGAQGWTYSYNGDGTLVGQASGGVTTGYAQDLAGGQSQVLAITTGSGAGAGAVDQLWGLDRMAALNPATRVRAWYGYDGQGSARQLLNDAGHVTASASYDPYGGPEGAALPSPFGYTGELTDPATGSQYLRARWYRPGQGTLLGVDPALDSTGQPYSYASDNPTNGSDPSGQCTLHGKRGTYNLAGVGGSGPCTRPELRGFITQFAGRNASPEQLDRAVQRVIDEVAAGQPSAAEPLDPGQGITPGQQAEAVRVSETGGGRVLLSGALEAVGIVLEAVGAVCAAFVAAVVITIGVVVLASGLVVVTAITAPATGSTAGEITPVPNPVPNPTATATATPTPVPTATPEKKTCAEQYPKYRRVNDPYLIRAGYTYRSATAALNALMRIAEDNLRPGLNVPATTGPCGSQSSSYEVGRHITVRYTKGKLYPGSIGTCPCCDDSNGTPRIVERAAILY